MNILLEGKNFGPNFVDSLKKRISIFSGGFRLPRLSWVRAILGIGYLGHRLSWARVPRLSWARAISGLGYFGPELSWAWAFLGLGAQAFLCSDCLGIFDTKLRVYSLPLRMFGF